MGIVTNVVLEHAARDEAAAAGGWTQLGAADELTEEELEQAAQQAKVKKALFQSSVEGLPGKSKDKVPWLQISSKFKTKPGTDTGSWRDDQGLGLSPLRPTTPFNDSCWQEASGVLCMQLCGADPEHKTWDLGFSRDGQRLVTCGSDGCVVLYHTADGSEEARIQAWEEVTVQSVAMSPCGRYIAAGGADGFVKAWDCGTAGQLPQMIMSNQLHKIKKVRRRSFSVSRVAFSRDSAHIATAGHDGKVVVWSLSEGRAVLEYDLRHEAGRSNGMLHVEFSECEGRNLVLACGDKGTVLVMDLATGQKHRLDGLHGIVLHCCFSKNSKYVAACSSEGKAHIWSVDGHDDIKRLFNVTTGNIHSIAFDPESTQSSQGMPDKMLLGDDHGKMTMINLKEAQFGNQMGVLDARGFGAGCVRHVCFSADGRFILGAGTGEECLIFDADTMALLYKLEPGFPGAAHMCASFSPDSCKVAVGLDESGTGAVVVWDITPGAPSTLLCSSAAEEESDWVPHSHFVGAGSHVALTTPQGALEVWDAQSSAVKSSLPGMLPGMASVASSTSGTMIAVGTVSSSGKGHVQVWDTARPKAPPSQFEMPGKAVAISSGGIHVAGWKPGNRKVIITHVADAAASAEVEWSGARLSAFKFSSNGSHAILAGDQPHLEVYKLGSRKPIPSDRPEAIAGDSVEAFTDCDSYETADGVFAIGAITTNGLVYVWESTRGALSLSFSSHYPGHIPRKVKFSPDGSSLVTYGSTGYIIVWPLEGGGQLRRVLGGRRMHSKGVYDCAWSADSSMLVSCGEDGDEGLEEAHVYDALTGRVLASLAGEPSHRFIQGGFSLDGRLVQLVRTDGKVAVFTRAAAMCMMKTDFSCWYNEAVTGFRTDEVVEALQRFPQSANHLNSKGHNLITAATEFQDSETLERVVNLMPAGSPVFSLIGRGRDALGLAIRKADDGMVYDLLMSVADGKATHMSAASVTSCWAQLCESFPALVTVFLSKMQLETVLEDFKYGDSTGILDTEQERDKMIVSGSAEYEPDSVGTYWDACLREKVGGKKGKGATEGDTGEPAVRKRCNSLRVSLPFASAPGNAGLLKPLLESQVSTQVFGTPIIRALLKWKWESFARRSFMLECLYHMLQLVCFTTFAILLSYEQQFPCDGVDSEPPTFVERFGNPISIAGLVMETFSLAIALRNLSKEIMQMIAAGSLMKYFADAWNILDFISYTIIIFILPLNLLASQVARCEQGQYVTPGLNQLVAIEVIFLWGELVHFAQGFRETGALVRIIERTIADIKWFMLLQIILMIGFGTALNVLFLTQRCDLPEEDMQDGYTCNIAYSDIAYSLISMVGLVLGDIAVLDYYKGSSPSPYWTTGIMILYEFIVFVVLFNMLIALMGETFVEVKSVEEVEFLRGRADIICGVEDTMRKKRLADKSIFSKYLHVLEIKEDAEVLEALEGISGENEAKRSLQSLQEMLVDELATVKAEIADQREDMKNMLRAAHRTLATVQTPARTAAAPPPTRHGTADGVSRRGISNMASQAMPLPLPSPLPLPASHAPSAAGSPEKGAPP